MKRIGEGMEETLMRLQATYTRNKDRIINQLAKPTSSASSVSKQSVELPAVKASPLTLKDCPKTQAKLAEMIENCYHTQRTFGKEVAAYPQTVTAFLCELAEYPANSIIPAFKKFIRLDKEFPTVADICGIIEERVKLDKALFMELSRKPRDGGYLSDKEHDYLRKYKQQVFRESGIEKD